MSHCGGVNQAEVDDSNEAAKIRTMTKPLFFPRIPSGTTRPARHSYGAATSALRFLDLSLLLAR